MADDITQEAAPSDITASQRTVTKEYKQTDHTESRHTRTESTTEIRTYSDEKVGIQGSIHAERLGDLTEIRKYDVVLANTEDLERISRAIEEVRAALAPEDKGFVLPKTPEDLRMMCDERGAWILSVFNQASEGQLAAYSVITPRFHYEEEGVPEAVRKKLPKEANAAMLSTTGVLPAERDFGLQKGVIMTRAHIAEEDGAKMLFTEVAVRNAASFGSLLRCGFTIRTMYDNTEDGEPCYGLACSVNDMFVALRRGQELHAIFNAATYQSVPLEDTPQIGHLLDRDYEGIAWNRDTRQITFAQLRPEKV